MNVLSIDPGGSNGWALWTSAGEILKSGTAVGELAFYQMLDETKDIQTYVVEEYRLYPHMAKQQIWSSFDTIQRIGAVKLMAWKRGANVVEQPASIKSIAYKLSGVTKPTVKAKEHRFDAIVHGYHYFYKLGLLKGPIA
jgi:hypothetical protein